jgi:hypothetical protein
LAFSFAIVESAANAAVVVVDPAVVAVVLLDVLLLLPQPAASNPNASSGAATRHVPRLMVLSPILQPVLRGNRRMRSYRRVLES